jgi:hypothetical protein
VLIGVPTVQTNVANPTPINFGLVQSVDLDIAITNKTLFGQNRFPVAIGQGTTKITGKAKIAKISGMALAQLFFGLTPAAGSTISAFGESHAYGATVTVTNAATFVPATTGYPGGGDLGVLYASTGLPLTLVTVAPSVGQYEVNPATGVYTFAAADSGNGPFLISYRYTSSSIGENFTVANTLIGPTSMVFSANLFAYDPTVSNQQFSIYLYNCIAEKLTFGTKIEDFVIPDLDFQVFANAAGNVMQFNMGDKA